MYEVEECAKGELKKILNAVDQRGGTLFQILDSTRKDFVIVVWVRHQQEKRMGMR